MLNSRIYKNSFNWTKRFSFSLFLVQQKWEEWQRKVVFRLLFSFFLCFCTVTLLVFKNIRWNINNDRSLNCTKINLIHSFEIHSEMSIFSSCLLSWFSNKHWKEIKPCLRPTQQLIIISLENKHFNKVEDWRSFQTSLFQIENDCTTRTQKIY